MRSRESVIAELQAKKIKYVDEMEYSELVELLAFIPIAKVEEKPEKMVKTDNIHFHKEVPFVEGKSKKPLDIPSVPVGLRTINDHERRITILERMLNV